MKSFLLLLLSLASGGEARSEGAGCTERWADFTWKYTKPEKFKKIIYDSKSIKKRDEECRKHGRFHCYHDTQSETVRLVIKDLQPRDAGEYSCIFHKRRTESVKLEIKAAEKTPCQKPFEQTAYATAKTTIACDFPHHDQSSVKFFCKENNETYEEIVSTQSSQRSKGTFALSITGRGFDVSISNVSRQDAGVYWCGFKIGNDTNPRVGLQKIQLKVQDTSYFTRSHKAGEELTYWCNYQNVPLDHIFICKGEDPSICQTLLNRTKPDVGRFSMTIDEQKTKIFVTVRNLTAADAGAYWCGAETTAGGRSKVFNRLVLTVGPSDLVTPAPDESHDGFSELVVAVILVSVAMTTTLLLILILICKRRSSSHGSGIGAAARQDGEVWDVYEMQEHDQTPGTGNDLHANLAAPPHYAAVHFRSRPGGAGAEAPVPRPSSSTCVYTTLKFVPGPSDSGAPQDPVYSNVNKPKIDRKK